MQFIEVALRTVITFGVLLLLTRILGKKQISQLTFFNYITGITIGALSATFTIDENITITEGATSILGWSILTLLFGYIGLKSSKARVLMNGQPTIVIRNGKILDGSLAKCRLNMDNLSMMLRKEHCFSVKDVQFAILEPNGELSVMKKQGKETITKADLNIKTQEPKYLPTEIIVDGNIVYKNLVEMNVGKDWLEKQLSNKGISINEVFYAELQSDGSLHINKYEKHSH